MQDQRKPSTISSDNNKGVDDQPQMAEPAIGRFASSSQVEGVVPYRAVVSYVGTKYQGFQSQTNGPCIQNVLEHGLSLYLRKPTPIRGSSRTDSGVHADGQVIKFFAPANLDLPKFIYSFNAVIPPDICIKHIEPSTNQFDPIYSAQAKAYRYRLWLGRCTNPFVKPYVWDVNPALDLEKIRKDLQAIVGRHNFNAFCSQDTAAKTRVRTILEVHLELRGPLVEIWIVGEGFLKQMVRIIVGTLVDIALKRYPPGGETMAAILATKDRTASGRTAPARGLSLVEVFYDEIPKVSEILEKAAKGFTLTL